MTGCAARGILALICTAVFGACSDSPFGDLGETLDAQIANPDTTIFASTTATFSAVAQYRIGPGEPRTVAWGTDDTTIIRLVVSIVDRTVRVTGRDTGQAFVFAVINEDFRDSVQVTVVTDGMLRTRRALGGLPTLQPALDDSGNVYVLTEGAESRLLALRPSGDTLFDAAACPDPAPLSPAVRTGVAAYTTGPGCTRRHGTAGNVEWSRELGSADGGVAIAANEDVVLVAAESGAAGDAVVLTRLSPAGDTLWRDTLARDIAPDPASAPSIASDGAIYVTWRTDTAGDSVAQVQQNGTRRWSRGLPGPVRRTGPALAGNRLYVAYRGGVIAFDTAGTELWRRDLTADLPGAATDEEVSSPVVDRDGNVYVLSPAGLVSYAPDGQPRWAADSLGGGSAAAGVAAPTILVTGSLLVPCGDAFCGVEKDSGALQWRTPLGSGLGGATVDLDGRIFVVRRTAGGGELVELWGRRLPEFAGWPTEGGGQDRSRRRL